jgi:hypothetical protein
MEWIKQIRLEKAPVQSQENYHRPEVSAHKIDWEFNRKSAIECSRRCLWSREESNSTRTLSFGEESCVNRCLGKISEAKQITDFELAGQISDPIPFAQTLP